MNITSSAFGITQDGAPVERYTLSDGAMSVSVLTLGGILQSIIVPNRHGVPVDVALGFDTVGAYEAQACYIGATIGRCANRIAGGTAPLGGRMLHLACNDNGICHLHGGPNGFDRRIWSASVHGEALTLAYDSPDGECGYPGTLRVSVTYRLEGGALTLSYRAHSDQDTLCNLTNHTYFNLAGHDAGTIDMQQVCMHADCYTPMGDSGTATGEIASVAGTPLDLRTPIPFVAHWDDGFDQMARAGGYDHNFLVAGTGLRPIARARCAESGIVLAVESDMPGAQLYSGNFLRDDLPTGKGGARYGRRHGFCIETQYPPNAPNCPAFAQPILHADDIYQSITRYRFSAQT